MCFEFASQLFWGFWMISQCCGGLNGSMASILTSMDAVILILQTRRQAISVRIQPLGSLRLCAHVHVGNIMLNKDALNSIEDLQLRYTIMDDIGACDGYKNGAYYWSCEMFEPRHSLLILSFDFRNGVFKVLDPPPFAVEPSWACDTGKCMDSLALLCDSGNCDEVSQHVDFRVMTSPDVDTHGIPS